MDPQHHAAHRAVGNERAQTDASVRGRKVKRGEHCSRLVVRSQRAQHLQPFRGMHVRMRHLREQLVRLALGGQDSRVDPGHQGLAESNWGTRGLLSAGAGSSAPNLLTIRLVEVNHSGA
jgi:hypothetical protein